MADKYFKILFYWFLLTTLLDYKVATIVTGIVFVICYLNS